MLRLKTLNFKNIGRFVELQTISFDKFGNLVQVDAQNNITGGSSGSGKSTIFHAIDWVLGLNEVGTIVLQSRLTKEPIAVELLLDWDGREVRIYRSRKLSVTIDGVETTGNSKLADEKIDEILGMPKHLFHQLLHKQQGKSGFFLSQTPAQMNSFLTDCLNLGPIRSKIDIIDKKIKDLSVFKDQAQIELSASQAALEAIKSAQASLGEKPVSNIQDSTVQSQKEKLEKAESTLKALLVSNKIEKDALQAKKPKTSIIPYDKTKIENLEKEIKSLEIQITEESEKEHKRQSSVNNDITIIKLETNKKISTLKLEQSNKIAECKTTLTNLTNIVYNGKIAQEKLLLLEEKIKSIKNGTCHICLQPWQTEETKTEEKKLLKEQTECKIDIEASIFAAKEIETVKNNLIVLNDSINEEISVLNKKMNEELAILNEMAKPKISKEFVQLKEKILELIKEKSFEFIKEDEHNTKQNKENQKILEDFFQEQRILADKHQNLVNILNNEINEAKRNYEQTAQALATHLIALNRYQSSLDSLKNKENETSEKVSDNNKKLVDLIKNIEMAEEAKRCLKSYLSCSFDDALDSVSETATKILRGIPTMANATIRLEGTKETTSGAIKEQVNALLDNDGELDIPIKSLSGGEKSAVDLAIDLAVCEMIQEKTNKGIDLMILDEPFSGQDSVCIEQALEMLKSLNRRIFIVEHNNVAKEFISDKITVIRDGEISYIN